MGVISVTLPIDIAGKFRIRDREAAKKIVEEIKQVGERLDEVDESRLTRQKKAFDDAFGIWADRDPKEIDDLMREIRRRNSGRD